MGIIVIARGVSILTRPEGRVQVGRAVVRCRSCCLFQSSPGQKAGCKTRARRAARGLPCFNPHPARRPGASLSTPDAIVPAG